MPRFSICALRLSLLYLFLGFTLGTLILINKGVSFLPDIWKLLPAHAEALFFGFVTQLAIGMAYWILPRHPGGYRGNEAWFWVSLTLLNLGVVIIAATGVIKTTWLWLTLGRSLEGISTAIFLSQVWKRIRPS